MSSTGCCCHSYCASLALRACFYSCVLLLPGKDTTREGRCNGFSGRFEGIKVGGKCNKHKGGKGPKHGDKDGGRPHRPDGAEPRDFDPEAAHSDLPGARRSLSEHHDHHDKHHGDKHDGDKHFGKGKGKGRHHDEDSEHRSHHKNLKDADMTFEDLEGAFHYVSCQESAG